MSAADLRAATGPGHRMPRLVPMAALVALCLLLTACAGARGATVMEEDAARPPTPAAAPTASAPADIGDASAPVGQDPSQGAAADPASVDPLAITRITDAPTPSLPVTVTSADGSEVEVTDVSRIIPLTGSLAEVVFTLGLGDNVVARDIATTFEDAADLPLITHAHDVSAEGVLSLEPTLVLADTATGPPEAIEQLRRAGVPIVVFDEAWSLEEMAPRVRAVAVALGVAEAGEALVGRTEAEIEQARLQAPPDPPRVAFLYLRGSAGVYLIGGDGAGADSMIEGVGAVDAGTEAGLTKFTPITTEALISAAPDAILVMTKGLESVGGVDGLVEIPGIAQTPAGRDRRVVAVEDGLLLNFGPRSGQALALIAEQLYADVPAAP